MFLRKTDETPESWMSDRRKKKRFPLSLEMQFSAGFGPHALTGVGTIVNISSGGLAFRSESALQPATKIKATVQWPALLNRECTLKLMLEGHILRATGPISVMTIQKYEFRTS